MVDLESGATTHPTAIYVEDDLEWRDSVVQFIEMFSRVDFEEFICGSSIEEVEGELRNAGGPVVVIMDLRLGGEETPNFSGYKWLLDELEDFLHRNASALVFVISGQLNDVVRYALQCRGIPDNHIFDKGEWAEQRAEFVHVLREELDEPDDIAFQNIIRGVSGRNIDPFLTHIFRFAEDNSDPTTLPMLVQINDALWDPDGLTDLLVLGRNGPFVFCLGTAMTLVALQRDPAVAYVEASRSAIEPECALNSSVKATGFHHSLGERGDAAAIGLIDGGIDILHPALRDETGKTRLIALWDQTDPTGSPPAAGLPGTLHAEGDLNRYLETGEIPRTLTRRGENHGTDIASLAAERATEQFAGGVAPEARLIAVIPATAGPPEEPMGLGYAVSHLLALETIRILARERDLPVVGLLSRGLNAGPHDGTTLLERAVDAATGDGGEPGLVIVKSAGREHNRGGHARLFMEDHQLETLRWRITEAQPLCVLEVWFEATDRFTFRLHDPADEASDAVRWLDKRAHSAFAAGNGYAMTYSRVDHNNARSRLLVTLHAGSAEAVRPGIWALEIRSGAEIAHGTLDAWLEGGSCSSPYFLDHLSDETTLTIPATAHYLVTVGSVRAAVPYEVSPSSSRGPTGDGREKPDVAAPGEEIAVAGADSRSTQSDSSLAAAHVAGAFALLLSARAKAMRNDPSLPPLDAAQVLEALPRVVREPGRAWHPAMGHGVLDVGNLLKYFEAEPTDD